MKVSTSSTPPAGSFAAVVAGTDAAVLQPGIGTSFSALRPPKEVLNLPMYGEHFGYIPWIRRQRSGSLSEVNDVARSYRSFTTFARVPGT